VQRAQVVLERTKLSAEEKLEMSNPTNLFGL